MSLRIKFILSLFFIILVGWIDVFYFGTEHVNNYSVALRQAMHLITLGCIFLIGKFHWRHYPEKWIISIWNSVYFIFVILYLLSTGLYFTRPNLLPTLYFEKLIFLRTIFSGPLPFITVYVFSLFYRPKRN